MGIIQRWRARMLAAGVGAILVGGLTGCWNTRSNVPNPNTHIPKTKVDTGFQKEPVKNDLQPANLNLGANGRTSGLPAMEPTARLGLSAPIGPPPPGSGGSPPYFEEQKTTDGQPIARSTPGANKSIQPAARFGAVGSGGAPLPPPDAPPPTLANSDPNGLQPISNPDRIQRASFQKKAPVIDDTLSNLPARPKASPSLPPLAPEQN